MRRHLSLLALSAIPSLCAGQDDIDLWRSIVAGDVRTVTTYLQGGGDPNAEVRSPQGEPWRILKVALFDREQSVALALIQGGADFELLDVSLSTVVAEGMTDVFKALVAQRPGRLTESIARDPESILFPAASRGYGDMLQAVLEETARRRITWPPDVFTEGISAAISFRQNDLARSLLRYGARPTGTVLRVASRDGSAGIVRTLLQYGIDPMARLPESSVDPSIGARRAMEYAAVRYRNARNAYEREAARLIAVELTAAGAANENLVTHKPLFDGGLLKRGTVQQKPSERLLYAARYGYVEEVSSLLSQKAVDRDPLCQHA